MPDAWELRSTIERLELEQADREVELADAQQHALNLEAELETVLEDLAAYRSRVRHLERRLEQRSLGYRAPHSDGFGGKL